MFKKEILEIIRSKKLLILIILFGFIAISSPILAKLLPVLLKSMPSTPGVTFNIPEPTWKDAIDQLLKNISQIGMIVIIFIFAGSIADEKSKKTLEMVLSKPISRANFILAKFLASITAVKVVFLASMVIFYLYTISLLGSFSLVNFIWLSVFLLIYLILVLSLTLFFSTISASQIAAVGFTFLVQIVYSTGINYIKSLKDYSPSYVLSNYQELMHKGNFSDFLPSAIVSIILVLLFIAVSIQLFKKQEVER
jgi:ABC-2 type transport system permease protein